MDSSKCLNDPIQVLQPHLDVHSVIEKITQSGHQEEAFYICDVTDIIRKYNEWKIIMPRVETHYAVKCNDSKIVLEVLAALGTCFDCASKDEIRKVLSLGVSPNRIIFANPTKIINHLKYAEEMGVRLMTFDNVNELYKIKDVYPNARLLIRIKYDDLTASYVLGEKYGCDHELEAPELLRVAATLKLKVVGVCFHIGSGSKNYSIFANAIAAARHVFDVAAVEGYKLKYLDIGGGFPGEKKASINKIGIIINTALEEHFPDHSVKVTSEPGRYYVDSAFTLASNIHSMKCLVETDLATKNKTKIYMYYVDISVYGTLMTVLQKDNYTAKALRSKERAESYPSIVWGTTCDSCDKISNNLDMLPKMNMGEWIIFEDTGAYTLSTASEFNGFPTPQLHSIIDEESWLLLTEKVQFPMSKDRFVSGNTIEHFRTGLARSNRFRTNYF